MSFVKQTTNPAVYEFFAGRDPKGNPAWANDVNRSKPVLEWKNHLGSESITYIAPLRKYLLTTARLAENESNLPCNVLIFWESDRLTGPFRMIHYLSNWGPQGVKSHEWASNQGAGAWVKLTWPVPQRINKVRLFDRPSTGDWIRGGTLTFSDGSTEKLRAWLSNRAMAPGEVSFAKKTVDWLKFTVDAVDGEHAGLAEMEVYEAP